MDLTNNLAPENPARGEGSDFAQLAWARQPFEPVFEPRERIYCPSSRTKDISLVPVTNREYWMRTQAARRDRGDQLSRGELKSNEEVELGAQIGRFAAQMEEPVRRWLGSCLNLSDSRVILFSEFDGPRRGWVKKFLEVDAISVGGSAPDVLFEIKVAFKGEARGAAERQLLKRAKVLSEIHPHIRCAMVYVPLNPNARVNASDIAVGQDLTLDTSEFYRRIRGSTIPCITVELEPLVAFAERSGASPQRELIEAVRAEQVRRRNLWYPGKEGSAVCRTK